MLLRYLELDNFLSHEHEQVSFPEEGMFLLSGESGAGKSSFIIDAVAYSLYGVAPTRARKQAELLHEDHPGQPMSVRLMLDFEDGERVVIERGIDAKGAGFAKLYQPDKENPEESILLAEGSQPVSRIISKRLGGMTWQQFYAAFVARQSEIADLTTRNPADRKNLIHRMLGMRELEKAAELIAARLRRARAETDQLERSVGSFDLQDAQSALAEAKQRIEDAQARKQEAVEQLDEEISALKKLTDQRSGLEAAVRANADLDRLTAEVKAAQSELRQLEDSHERHRKAEQLLAGEEALREKHRLASEERDELRDIYGRSKEAAKKQEQLHQGGLQVEEISNNLVEPEMSAEQARARQGILQERIHQHMKELQEREPQLLRLQESGECYVCLRPFATDHDHQQVLVDLEGQLDELRAQIGAAEDEDRRLTEMLPALEKLEEMQRGQQQLRHRLDELAAEGELRSDLQALAAEGKASKEQLEQLTERITEIDLAKKDLRPDLEEQRSKAEKALTAAQEALGAAEQTAAGEEQLQEHQQLTETITQGTRQVAALEARIPELEAAETAAIREHGGLERELAGREKEIKSLESLRTRVLVTERVGTYLRAYQRKLADDIRPALEEIGSEMLNRISGGRHVAMHIDDDYEISVETAGGAVLRASMLSGGEEIRTNICLRLALTRLVSQRTGVPVGFLVFDEPLPAQDPGHIERILELLDSLRPFYRQQFIISHVGDLRAADEMDYVLEFDNTRTAERAQLINA